MKIAIIDYNAGNVQSVKFALHRLGFEAVLTQRPEEITSADKVIFPGVGEAQYAMEQLKYFQLDLLIPTLTQPVLGICLGMQLLCQHSEESDTPCLGIFKETVQRFFMTNNQLKVPQMGWNCLENLRGTLFQNVLGKPYAYFVHSYYVPVNEHTSATAHYGHDFSACLQKDNFFATQFHPEKSGSFGEQLLRNFINL